MMLVITALKVIGICLLVLLIIVLLLLGYVLFAPVKYDLGLDTANMLWFYGDIRDLFGLARLNINYKKDEGLGWGLYLFHLRHPFLPKDKSKRAAEDEEAAEISDADEKEGGTQADPADAINEAVADIPDATGNAAAIKDKSARKGRKRKSSDTPDKEKKGYIDIIRDPSCKRAIKFLFSEAIELIKRLLPKRITADLDFSTGEPDLTGQLTGALAMMPFSYGKKVRITPDFSSEDPFVSGELELAGSIALFRIIGVIIRVFFNKDVRKLYRRVK